jgi:hypothetical protein
MKQKLIDKLGLTFSSKLLAVLNSKCGVGKTNLLCFISAEFHNEGKRVLFLTNECSVNTIRDKTRVKLDPLFYGKLPYLTITKYDNLDNKLYDEIIKSGFDVIIFDDSHVIKKESFQFVEKLKQKFIVLISNQHVKDLNGTKLVGTSLNKMQKADIFIDLTIKDKFTFLEKAKYFFCFWLNKPNRTINLIKNKYANINQFDFYFDFKNNNIKYK